MGIFNFGWVYFFLDQCKNFLFGKEQKAVRTTSSDYEKDGSSKLAMTINILGKNLIMWFELVTTGNTSCERYICMSRTA